MSIIEKMSKIVNDGDTTGAEQLIHDDFQFLMHASGKTLTKKDVVGWVGMKDVKKSNVRVLLKTMKWVLNMLWYHLMMVTKKLL